MSNGKGKEPARPDSDLKPAAFSKLPTELHYHISSFLSGKDRSELSVVSSYFYDIAHVDNSVHKNSVFRPETKKQFDDFISYYKHRECNVVNVDLNLIERHLSNKDVDDLLKIAKKLESLVLSIFPKTKNPRFREIIKIPAIRVSKEEVTDSSLINLANTHPNIKSLHVIGPITSLGLENLTKLSSIESLVLLGFGEVSGADIEKLTNLSNLDSLALAGCEQVTDKTLDALAKKLPNLKRLDLSYCEQITDAGLKSLSELPNLTSIYLVSCDKITDAGLRCLAKNPNLKVTPHSDAFINFQEAEKAKNANNAAGATSPRGAAKPGETSAHGAMSSADAKNVFPGDAKRK